MKILITGGREWDNLELIRQVLQHYPKDTVIIHGAQKTQKVRIIQQGPHKKPAKEVYYIGADFQADKAAKELGLKVIPFLADWDGMEAQGKPRGAAGPIRNQKMIDEKPDLVLAFHPDWHASKGTKDTIRRALWADIDVIVYDGKSNQTLWAKVANKEPAG